MGTREALIDAATELLDQGGVERVTLREVGSRAGVSHNAPYKHFAHKQALLAQVAARELTVLGERIATVRARERRPAVALRKAMRMYVTWALAHPERFRLVFGPWVDEPKELTDFAMASWRMMVDFVAEVQRAGGLPAGDPERLAALIRALTQGAIDLALTGHLSPDGKGKSSPESLVDDLFRYLGG